MKKRVHTLHDTHTHTGFLFPLLISYTTLSHISISSLWFFSTVCLSVSHSTNTWTLPAGAFTETSIYTMCLCLSCTFDKELLILFTLDRVNWGGQLISTERQAWSECVVQGDGAFHLSEKDVKVVFSAAASPCSNRLKLWHQKNIFWLFARRPLYVWRITEKRFWKGSPVFELPAVRLRGLVTCLNSPVSGHVTCETRGNNRSSRPGKKKVILTFSRRGEERRKGRRCRRYFFNFI